MQPVIDISRLHSWQSSGDLALVSDYSQHMQQPSQHQQQAGSLAAPPPWQTVVYPSHPTQTASSIAAPVDVAHFASYDTSGLSSQQQQRQQLDQDTESPAVPSFTDLPGLGHAAVANPCNKSSPQMSGTSGANDAEAAQAEPMPEGLQDGGDPSSIKPNLPVVQLKVACGDQVGTLLVHKAKIIMFEGTPNEKEVSPTEFERLGGRSATKKWKQSIRLIDDDGDAGRPVGEWYIQQGLEQPKKPRDIKDAPSTSTAPLGSTSPTNHDTRYSATAAAQAAAAAVPTGPNKRPVRSTRGHVPPKHVSAAAEGSPVSGRSSRRGYMARTAAPAAAGRAYLWDDSGSGTTDSPDDPVAAAATAQDAPWTSEHQLQQQYIIQQTQPQIMLPDPHVQQQQQQGYGGLTCPADSTAAVADEAAALSLDYASLGDWQLPPAAAAGPAGILVQVPVSAPLPGDSSQAVVEMRAYLEGRRRIPPWRLLPPAQRPVVGKYLVPLRTLFVLVLHAGGLSVIQDDLLTWQEFASQLGLPAWPCPDAPDPLRALQQVYRDYLLRFEGKFTLQTGNAAVGVTPSADPAATAAAGGGSIQGLIQQSSSLSGATQFAGQGGVVQVPQGLQTMHGVPLSTGTTYVPFGGGMLDTTNLNNFNSTIVPVLGNSLPQQQQQQQPLVNDPLPAALAAEIMLDDNLSGDLLDFLTDLIPDSDSTAAAAAAQPQQQGGLQLPPAAAAAAAAPAGPVEAASGIMQVRAAAGAAAPLTAATAVMRQHPEMTSVQQRQRLQQLQQHLQYLQQQQQQQQQYQSGGDSPAVQPGLAAAGCAVADGGAAAAAGRSKRPAPLIRCGDSDVISLMDQSEVTKLLQEFEQQQQQQQRRQLATIHSRQQQLPPGLAPQQQQHPSSSQLAAAVAGAVDRKMSQDLHAMMQQYWNQQQQVVTVQQGEQQYADELHTQTADEEMSGMLESLQLTGDAAAGGQPQGDLLLLSPNNSASGWSNKLLGQMSIGARLMGDLMAATAAGSSSGSSHVQTMHISGDHIAAAGGMHPITRLMAHPNSYTMLPPAPRNNPQQQQQQGSEDLLLSSQKEGQGLGQGLLHLTTPNSAMFASVLDSPTLRTSGPSGAGWMDMSGPLSTTGNLKNMTVELPGVEGSQDGGEQGLQGDDLSAVLRMW